MIVSNVISQKMDDQVEVSALIDGYRLWYRFPDKFSVSSSAEPFTVNVQAAVPDAGNEMVCGFFSGGVDGLYTLFNNESQITHLIYINGYDFHVSSEEFKNDVQRLKEWAAPFEKEIIPVETNFYEFDKLYGVGRYWAHGTCLISAALLLQSDKCILPTNYFPIFVTLKKVLRP